MVTRNDHEGAVSPAPESLPPMGTERQHATNEEPAAPGDEHPAHSQLCQRRGWNVCEDAVQSRKSSDSCSFHEACFVLSYLSTLMKSGVQRAHADFIQRIDLIKIRVSNLSATGQWLIRFPDCEGFSHNNHFGAKDCLNNQLT